MVTLEERLRRLEALPSVSPAMGRLLTLLSQEEPDPAEIAGAFRSDPALSMAALRLANSARFGGERVDSVHEAAVRLGHRNLHRVVMLQFSSGALRDAGACYGLDEGQAWRSALAGAIAAEWIAARTAACDPQVAFTASLLRDCGKMAMDHLLSGDEMRATLDGRGRAVDQITLERESFELDHAEVGAVLASLWDMPEELVEAIRLHHAPPARPPVPLVDVVHASDVTAVHLGMGLGLDGLHYVLHEDALARLGFDRDALAECMHHTLTELAALERECRPGS